MINQKGLAPLLIIVGLFALIVAGIFLARGYFASNSISTPAPSPSYSSLSEDPKYDEVKQKYNLNEEQLKILSTVDPNDND